MLFKIENQPKTLLSPRAEHEDDEDEGEIQVPASKLLGFANASTTPPPSPADFLMKENNILVASKAEAERMDLTQQLLNEEKHQEEKEKELRHAEVTFEDLSSEGSSI